MTIRTAVLTFRNLVRRIPILLGYTPNVEWLRARLSSRTLPLDRARAHLAMSEIERCLRIHRQGSECARFWPSA